MEPFHDLIGIISGPNAGLISHILRITLFCGLIALAAKTTFEIFDNFSLRRFLAVESAPANSPAESTT